MYIAHMEKYNLGTQVQNKKKLVANVYNIHIYLSFYYNNLQICTIDSNRYNTIYKARQHTLSGLHIHNTECDRY